MIRPKLILMILIALTLLSLAYPRLITIVPAYAQSSTEAAVQEVNFPELTGPYKVGRMSYEWVDQERREAYAEIDGLKRDLVVHIWFPAAVGNRAKIVPYMDGDLMWDIQWRDYRGLETAVHSHAYRSIKVNDSEPAYPVLIFAHGYRLHGLN